MSIVEFLWSHLVGRTSSDAAKFSRELTWILAVALLFLTVFEAVRNGLKRYLRNLKLPPGPKGLPIVGILPFLPKKDFYLCLYDYAKAFGSVCSARVGGATLVVLSDYKLIKKACQSTDFVARPKTSLSDILNGYGIVNSEGDLWKSQRRFLLNQKMGMRHFGGQSMAHIELAISREVIGLLEAVVKDHSNGTPFDPSHIFNCAISNVICSMIMSKRFEHKDKRLQHFMHLFDEGFRLFTMTGAMMFLPILKHLPGIEDACKKLKSNRASMLGFVREVIDEHKKVLNPEAPRDLIDAYLIKIQKIEEENHEDEMTEEVTKDIFHGYDATQQMEQIILDLFSAGVETLKTSLLWSIVYMLHNPEVKRKINEETDRVVGSERLPEIADMSRLPYTKATICEVMRRSSVVPMGTTHATTQTIKFEGYEVPRNAHVVPLLHAVHMDPKNFAEPEAFRPERFLSEDGSCVRKPECFMPFGVGRRQCLGDNLAEKEFFLFFTSFMHFFDVTNPPETDLPPLKGVAGATVNPTEFRIICQPRAKLFYKGKPVEETTPITLDVNANTNKHLNDRVEEFLERATSKHHSRSRQLQLKGVHLG